MSPFADNCLIFVLVFLYAKSTLGFTKDNPNLKTVNTRYEQNSRMTAWTKDAQNEYVVGDLKCACGTPMNTLQNRVTGIGTEPAKVADIPWTAALFTKSWQKAPFCGATLINNQFAITAAHCVKWKKSQDLEIRLNEENIHESNETLGGELILGISEVLIHPEYVSVYRNDIALLRLKELVDLEGSGSSPSVRVHPICISSQRISTNSDYAGENATIAGWGQTSFSGKTSPILLKNVVPILSNAFCNEKAKFKGAIRDFQLCAGEMEAGGPDSCPGDSGGPLIVHVKDRAILAGIVSWGFGCGEENSPGVYTRVNYYTDWILENTRGSASGWCGKK